jgi:transcription factor TGA
VDTGQQFVYQKGNITTGAKLGNGHHIESWGESGMAADTSQQTDTSTDVDTDDKNQVCACFFYLFTALCCRNL